MNGNSAETLVAENNNNNISTRAQTFAFQIAVTTFHLRETLTQDPDIARLPVWMDGWMDESTSECLLQTVKTC